MAVDVRCSCGAKFRVGDQWAGRRAKCKNCGAVVTIPSPAQPAAPPAPAPVPAASDPLGSNAPPADNTFSDLFDEDIPVAATGGQQDGFGGEPSLQITVRSDVEIPGLSEVSALIEGNLARHIARSKSGMYRQVQLDVFVEDWYDQGTDKRVALSFVGTVNGKRVNKSLERETVRTRGVGNVAAKMFDSAAKAMRGTHLSQQIVGMIEGIVDDACVHMDRIAGGGKMALSKLWEILDIVKVSLSAGSLLAVLGFAVMKGGMDDFKASLLMALVVAGAVFALVHVVQVFVMPGSFYTQDARGRRILTRWKVKTAAALRVRILIMAVISGAALVGFWMIIASSLDDRPGQRSPQEAPQGRPPGRVSPMPPSNGRAFSPGRSSSRSTGPSARSQNQSRMVGGYGGPEATEFVEEGGLIYGLECSTGEYAGQTVVRSVKPCFDRASQSPSSTNSVVAKEGYALGDLDVYATNAVCGLRVTFMRVKPDGALDPEDSYTSDWLVTKPDLPTVKLNPDRRRVIGLRVRQLDEGTTRVVSAIGLVYD